MCHRRGPLTQLEVLDHPRRVLDASKEPSRRKQCAALFFDPSASASIRHFVSRVPRRRMAAVFSFGLFSNEHQRTVQVCDERIENSTTFDAVKPVDLQALA